MEIDFIELEQSLNYVFKNKIYAIQALTHPSFVHEQINDENNDYQRLEFLGDSILGMLLTEMLFIRFPEKQEGFLSRFRSQIVDQETLATASRRFGLGKYIRLGRGEEHCDGRNKDSILADVIESLIAAVYLDGGIESARNLVILFFEDVLNYQESVCKINDPKSELQELLSLRKMSPPFYLLLEESGPPHEKVFKFQVLIDQNVAGEGVGKSKKIAQQAAAAEALKGFAI